MDRKNRFLLAILLLIFCVAGARAYSFSDLPISPLPPVQFPKDNPMTPQKIELGKKLFFDRRLSGDGTMSCASCHDPEKAFTDGREISLSYPTTRNLRNAPTLLNVAYAKSLFWDGRASSLEQQVLFPLTSPFEMNQNLDFAIEEIRVVPEYREETRRVFKRDVDKRTILYAIACFERTLTSKGAPLDLYLLGDKNALSDSARRGLEVFLGKGKCVKCHFGPYLSDQRFHALNVPENPRYEDDPRLVVTRRYVAKINGFRNYKEVKEDLGRYFRTGNMKDYRAFRTPTLREISRTAPYMHNGVFRTLEEVIEFFNKGGGEGNKVLTPLGLTEEERQDLRSFLEEALAGKVDKFVYPSLP